MLDDAIAECATVARLQNHWIADFHFAHDCELRIAMRGDDTVADRLRLRSAVHVTRAECHRASAGAGEDDVAATLTRKLDSGHGPRVGPSPRLDVSFAVDRSRPRSLEEELRELRLRKQVGTMSEGQHAGIYERTDEDEALSHFVVRCSLSVVCCPLFDLSKNEERSTKNYLRI